MHRFAIPTRASLKLTLAALVALCLASAAVIEGCGDDGENEHDRILRIYTSQPLVGGRGGGDTLNAIRIAVEDAGSSFGGAKLEVVGLNDAAPSGAFDPALVRRNANRAARDDSTIAFIGDFDSGATEISMPILNRAGILQVSSASTAVQLTRSTPAEAKQLRPSGIRNFGRVVPNDSVQSAAMGLFMNEESVSRVFVVDDGGVYGTGLAGLFDKVAARADIEVEGRRTIDRSTKFKALAKQIDGSGAQALFFAGSDLDLAYHLFRTAHHEDIHLKLFGGDAIAIRGFLRTLGELELDTYVTAPMLPEGNYASSGESFLSGFRDRYGRVAEPMAVFGYEAGLVVDDSIRNETRGDVRTAPIATLRKGVRDKFFQTTERPSALGSYSIDAYGDTTLTFYGAYRVENGRLVLGRAIDPPLSYLEVVGK